MEWYHAESMVIPPDEDLTSSKCYNYVRKNIKKITEETDGELREKYVWDECRIPKEAWGLYLAQKQQNEDIDSCMVALTELYEMMEV